MDKLQLNKILGNHIRVTREEKKLTQAELAALMNVNPQNISSYERGERCPSIFWITKLCEALEINPIKFMTLFYEQF